MDSFVKKIIEKKADEKVHKHFIRFSKGNFSGRFVIGCWITGKIKLNGTFEWANDFVEFFSELVPRAKVSGILLTKEELDFPGKRGKEINTYEVNREMASEELKHILERAYSALFDMQEQDIILKIKKKLPKPGKSAEAKADDKFCVLELPLHYLDKVKHTFFPDIHSFKKVKAEHTIIINEIKIPEGEKDFEKIRIHARKKGKLIRKANVDGSETIKEYELEA